MTDKDIATCLDLLHRRILHSNLAEFVTEAEVLALVEVVDLINRQQAEIKRLRTSIKEADKYFSEGEMGKGLAIIINLAQEKVGDSDA